MNAKIKLTRFLIALSGALFILVPATASAHDNLGGDELAATDWMLIAALVVATMAIIAGIWGFTSGQFNNIEKSKYTMLDYAEDFDAIMAEADARERAAKLTEAEPQARKAQGQTAATPQVRLDPKAAQADRAPIAQRTCREELV